jgi:hypothetical protein
MRLVHAAEQSVQDPKQIDEFDRANHFGGDAELKEPRGSEDVVGGCSRVPGDNSVCWGHR